MAETLRCSYDNEADLLDISILNFTKWFKALDDSRPIPVTARFTLAGS